MKILAFGASNSLTSINKKLVTWAAHQIKGGEVNLIDLNDYEMPIYSPQREAANGLPQEALDFRETLEAADGVLISFAEYNGSYTAAFKNIFDWMSRAGRSRWADKPMLLMSTSEGGRGGQNVLDVATKTFPYQGGKVAGRFALPSFSKNFTPEDGITDEDLRAAFAIELAKFEELLAGQ